MLSDNNTPFAAIGFEQWHRDGGTMAVIAVRGEYAFTDDGSIALADKQDIVLADEFAGDPHKTPLVRPGDLVPFKPGTDLTFQGTAYAPGGQAARSWEAAIQVLDIRQPIRVSGPRDWVANGKDKGWTLSEAAPVTEVPLCYSRASGGRMIGDPDGTVDPRNPIGVNLIHAEFTPSGRDYPAAQIDSTDHPVTHWDQRPPLPQGFGPMAPWWRARQCFTGTYDKHWEENVHPRLPGDFDYRFYNCAHPNLAFTGYLAGDETVSLTNLTPAGQASFDLPGVVPYASFKFTDGREVVAVLNLDGVHIDFREAPYRFTLTWRAWIEICPAFYRIDLDYGLLRDVAAMNLPLAGESGLIAA